MAASGRIPRPLIAAMVALMLPAGGLTSQSIRGVALDRDGDPLPDATVALHRVDDAGGAFVDAAVTDADGRFTFRIDEDTDAVHFVALRHQDRLYIGPPLRGDGADAGAYVVRAEPSAEAGALASALSGSGAGAAGGQGAGAPRGTGATGGGTRADAGGTGAGAFWLVGLLAVATAAIILLQAPVYRARRRRDLLVELATLENRLAEGAVDDRVDLEARRSAVRRRLEPAG